MVQTLTWRMALPAIRLDIIVVEEPAGQLIVAPSASQDEHVQGYWEGRLDAIRDEVSDPEGQALRLTSLLEREGAILVRAPLRLGIHHRPGMTRSEIISVVADAVRGVYEAPGDEGSY